MSKLHHNPVLIAPSGDMISLIADRARNKFGGTEPYVIVWWLFVASVVMSTMPRVVGEFSGPLSYIVAIGGSAGCAWTWLFSRLLFRPARPVGYWSVFAVFTVIAVESSWAIINGPFSTGPGLPGELHYIAGNAASMICIGALVLVFVEALSGYGASMSRVERRFRQIFVGVFGALVAVSILWVSNAGELTIAADWGDAVLAGCATVGVIASRAAISFRKRNPLAEGNLLTEKRAQARPKSSRSRASCDSDLARRILDASENTMLLSTPGLKIAKFAEALGEQDYKVTQCITGQLQYRNFNHFINSHRIDYAKRALLDAKNKDRPILSIAFDCGFNSIGPFNRAFKQNVGVTPREFRMSRNNIRQQ